MNQISEQTILDALSVIKDANSGKDIVTLGFVQDLRINDGEVSFRIVNGEKSRFKLAGSMKIVDEKDEDFESANREINALFQKSLQNSIESL